VGPSPVHVLLDWTAADWLAPDALVVGFLTVRMDGFGFRSIVPNPARTIFVGVELIQTAVLSSVGHQDPRLLEVYPRMGASVRFLVGEAWRCQQAIAHAVTAHRHGGAYR
jgi:hypothetical protein